MWGIDIGKCALKALRCRVSSGAGKLEAVACEYIEYPMILTQPEADPVELVQSALEQLLSRNDLKGDAVAVSVPGNLGLSKFIKLPPIEAKKIPDIVKYEARQQIPFPLEQVVWRWQRLASGMEAEGFVLDAEVALFAMKREQVFKALAPLMQAGIQVDVLQLAPIALANVAIFDQLPNPETIDPDQPAPFIALVSVGVDSTDLVVTNGRRVWQRSIPSGGSNFTKSLVQGMKLTFSRAENLKRNAVKAEDPKAVFKTMKPVFNEFAAELQRSLNYFTGTDRSATIGKVLLLGNATKLRGLTDFIGQHLLLDVQRLDMFNGLEGAAVLSNPVFKEHQVAFGTAYGLALQAAKKAAISTNLLPNEIVRDRIIESKKPWAVGALLGLLAAALVSYFGMYVAWTAYMPNLYAAAFDKAEAVKKQSAASTAAIGQVRERQAAAIAQQQWLAAVQNRRFETLDMLRALQSLLPRDEGEAIPENPADRRELHIERLDVQYFPDLGAWFASVQQQWAETHIGDDQPAAGQSAPGGEVTEEKQPVETPAFAPPAGAGWIIELQGYHYHNEDRHKPSEGAQFLRDTLVRRLLGGKVDEKVTVSKSGSGYVTVPSVAFDAAPAGGVTATGAAVLGTGSDAGKVVGITVTNRGEGYLVAPTITIAPPPESAGGTTAAASCRLTGDKVTVSAGPLAGKEVGVRELGIGYPVIVESSSIKKVRIPVANPVANVNVPGQAMPPAARLPVGENPEASVPQDLMLKRYDFVLQFCWQPRPAGEAVAAPPSAPPAAAPE
ncbi:MAG: type IV pilus assembly protein PilM [Planctomycetia bacterium]